MNDRVHSRPGWRIKAIGILMALGLALRWLAGHPEVSDGLIARVLGALDWLVLTGLYAGGLWLAARAIAACARHLWRRGASGRATGQAG